MTNSRNRNPMHFCIRKRQPHHGITRCQLFTRAGHRRPMPTKGGMLPLHQSLSPRLYPPCSLCSLGASQNRLRYLQSHLSHTTNSNRHHLTMDGHVNKEDSLPNMMASMPSTRPHITRRPSSSHTSRDSTSSKPHHISRPWKDRIPNPTLVVIRQ
jgi:hypothetical protein